MRLIFLTLCLLGFTQGVFGQYQIGLVPRKSPDKSIYQKVGYTEIEVKYSSPSVMGRPLWGKLVPYDEVWRAGANNATTMEFGSDVLIQGRKLKKGKYAFFLIPKENEKWIGIFHQKYNQWGAFGYDPNGDVLRVEILPRRNKEFTEELSYSIKQHGFRQGEIVLEWGYINISMEFTTNYLEKLELEVERRASAAPPSTKWVIYLQGAEHLENIDLNIPLARTWIDQSEEIFPWVKTWNENYYPKEYIQGHMYWVKAKLLAREGKFDQALAFGEKVKNLGDKPLFYQENNESEGIDDRLKEWGNK